jgi:hypothetical protein
MQNARGLDIIIQVNHNTTVPVSPRCALADRHQQPATSWAARIISRELKRERPVPIDSNHWALVLNYKCSCCSFEITKRRGA